MFDSAFSAGRDEIYHGLRLRTVTPVMVAGRRIYIDCNLHITLRAIEDFYVYEE